MSSHKSGKGKGRASPAADGAASADGTNLTSEANRANETIDNNASNTLDRIASSASSLLQSFLQPTANEVSSAVNTSQSSKAQASTTPGTGSFSTWTEASGPSQRHFHPSTELSTEKNITGFRTASSFTPTESIDYEFQSFSAERPPLSSAAAPREIRNAQSHQEDIIQLLSSSTLTEAIWEESPSMYNTEMHATQNFDRYRPNLQNAQVSEFLETDDIVEFLSREGTIYTEEVWGNMLGLLQKAREEIQDSEKKEKEQNERNNSLERLKMIRNQLKSKL